VTLLAGALALLGAGVPYSGVLLGAIVVVAMVMGGVLIGLLGSLGSTKGRVALTGKEGMIGEVGGVRRAVGVERWGGYSCMGSCGGQSLPSPQRRAPREILSP